MPAAEEGDQQLLDHLFLPDDDLRHLGLDVAIGLLQLGNGLTAGGFEGGIRHGAVAREKSIQGEPVAPVSAA